MIDFLLSTHPIQGAEVFNQWIPRARFGLHIRLGRLAEQVDGLINERQMKAAAVLMAEYFGLVGFSSIGLSGEEQLVAYHKLTELNALKWLLPFQTWQGPPVEPKPYDYSGRFVAWLIHKLASRYGWTPETIFNLWPEEPFFYLQEILISEYDETDEARSLSEVGYHYDQATKKATFRPIPRPDWMAGYKPQRVYRIRKDTMPVGHIIKLDEVMH